MLKTLKYKALLVMFYVTPILADTTLDDAIKSAGTKGQETIKLIGATLAGVVSVLTGVAALAILLSALWDSWKNNGAGEVFHNHGSKFIVLAVVAVFAGVITASYFS
ncbi:hypothetical protein EDD63_1503 [Breznakia blatticola]|uniref:TrbC/VIRB2 family protein n=1 Tax=Breznakia blatticola TaxID=1754012 RepID=A0A4V6Q887_9FIRM|nr:hypothetical protein [Breznakia blatticola]TDW13097.1 hypothetical protein EDD63_1503 [Breznakia blatticola]